MLRRYLSTLKNGSKLPPANETLSRFLFPASTNTISDITQNIDQRLNQTITLHGHLNRKPRIMSVNAFAELRDHTGLTQLILTQENTPQEMFDRIKLSGPEDSVSVTGKIKLKRPKMGEEHLKKWEIVVESLQILNSAGKRAAELDKLKHANPENLPSQLRYLQLRTLKFQDALRKRSKAASVIRDTLFEHDFVDIETPLLFKSTPEGAREFLVPTRTRNRFYALPQSPQQYKQILMSSGFTRYFQIAKCFRDEDLRSDRQPEFTQIDMEMAFIHSPLQVMEVVESLVTNVWRKVANLPIYHPVGDHLELIDGSFPKMTYSNALSIYGIDKPDLRSTLKINDLSKFFNSTKKGFPVVEALVLKGATNPKKPKIPSQFTAAQSYTGRIPHVFCYTHEGMNWEQKLIDLGFMTKTSNHDQNAVKKLLNLKPGDIVAISDRASLSYENPTPLGKFRQLAIAEYPDRWRRKLLVDGELKDAPQNVFVAHWLVDFPLFNPKELDSNDGYPNYDFQSLESTHHPFTMVQPSDYELLERDPLKARGEHYDFVLNGVEMGGGSRRIHDAALQQFVFEHLLKIKNYRELFGHLLDALALGCPPHAGLALGFDRLCALLIGSNSIRDVIAFPKNQSGIDPMVESPTSVSPQVLDTYNIALKDL